MDMEQDIKAAGANVAPRITPADIEANIIYEGYINSHRCDTLEVFVASKIYSEKTPGIPYHKLSKTIDETLGLLTVCVLVLRNGFTVTGESACASPENFDAEIGRKIARQNAIDKVWPLMGYELRSRLSGQDHKPSA